MIFHARVPSRIGGRLHAIPSAEHLPTRFRLGRYAHHLGSINLYEKTPQEFPFRLQTANAARLYSDYENDGSRSDKEQPVRKRLLMSNTNNNGQFRKGSTGNPAGRPRGSRNQATLACEQLLQAAAPDLIRVLIEEAQKGNMQAMRLCLDRMYPAPKERSLQLPLPPIESAKDLPIAYQEVTRALAEGRISAAEGQSVVQILM
jgi:hypothetical protein